MNTTSDQLIQQLADKLGTTAEYLWAAMLKQAGLAAIYNSVFVAAIAAAVYLGFRLLQKHSDTLEMPELFWMVYGILTLFAAGLIAITIGDTITAVFNPEYWALSKIINTK